MIDFTKNNAFRTAAEAETLARTLFLRKTYALTAAAFVCWAALEALLFISGLALPIARATLFGGSLGWLAVLLAYWFGMSFAQRLTFSRSAGRQYAGLAVYVALEAFIFVPLIMAVCVATEWHAMDVLLPAGVSTLALIASLTTVVFVGGADFSFLRRFVVMGMYGALAAAVIIAIFGINPGSVFALAMIALMAAAILWQTWRIKEEMPTDSHVAAAAMCFGSFMTLFWYAIQLFMRRR